MSGCVSILPTRPIELFYTNFFFVGLEQLLYNLYISECNSAYTKKYYLEKLNSKHLGGKLDSFSTVFILLVHTVINSIDL